MTHLLRPTFAVRRNVHHLQGEEIEVNRVSYHRGCARKCGLRTQSWIDSPVPARCGGFRAYNSSLGRAPENIDIYVITVIQPPEPHRAKAWSISFDSDTGTVEDSLSSGVRGFPLHTLN